MATHNKKESYQIGRIRSMMTEAGIYERRFEIQIEQTAENMAEIDEMKSIIRKEGRIEVETKTGGVGNKRAPHPLIVPMQAAQALLVRQLGALGLNKMQEKKSEAKEAKTAKKDGVETFFGG